VGALQPPPPSPAAPPAPPDPPLLENSQVLVIRHNRLRTIHQAPALTWSDSLALQAAVWVGRCNLAAEAYTSAGENLYSTSGIAEDITMFLISAVESW
jgi:hypothetical protein